MNDVNADLLAGVLSLVPKVDSVDIRSSFSESSGDERSRCLKFRACCRCKGSRFVGDIRLIEVGRRKIGSSLWQIWKITKRKPAEAGFLVLQHDRAIAANYISGMV